jgi:DNA-binding CsgD family transcriptional regulator/tetratricopeptide (TPR) repeat protein
MELLERASQLQALNSALSQVKAREGQGYVALVYGEAGIGKTSLIEHLVNENKKSRRILQGVCDSLFTPRPLGPLHDIALQTRGNLLHLLDSESNRGAIFSACLSELKEQATILVIEDIHWADEATLDLLKYLGRRIRQTVSLLILTYRDDEIGADHPLRILLGDLASSHALYRIPVSPLSREAVRELAKNKKTDPVELYRLTSGNPFFVTEVLAGESGLPETVRDAVLARAARLSLSARAVLEAAAVIGTRVEPWLLSNIVGAESVNIEEWIAIGMLNSQGDYYAFRHELARQTILESLSPQRKIVLHRMVLNALKGSSETSNDFARLANHAEGAKDEAAVIEYAPAAARQASAVSSHREAAAQYARALRFGNPLPADERARLFEGEALECYLTGQAKEAIHSQREAIALWRGLQRPDKVGAGLRFLSRLLLFMANFEEARQCVFEAIEILEKLPPGIELANAYAARAHFHMLADEDEELLQWGTRAIELAESLLATETLIFALNTVGNSEQFSNFDNGTAKLKRSLELALEYGLHEQVARAYLNLGLGASFHHQYENAHRYYANAIEYATEHDLDSYIFFVKRHRARTFFEQSRWMEAALLAGEVINRDHDFSMNRIAALVVLGHICVRRGDPGADALLEEANSLADASEPTRIVPMAAARAEAAWLKDDLEQTLTWARLGIEAVRRSQITAGLGEMSYWMWRAGELSEIPGGIESSYALQINGEWRRAADEWARIGRPYEQAMALMDGDESAQLVALEIFERLGARPISEKLKQKMRTQGIRIPRGPRPATRENPFGLTAREVEVVALIAQGKSNREIAEAMVVGVRTVETYVTRILSRLSFDSRVQIATWAIEKGLWPSTKDS